jgi:hypothetical protein
MASAILALCLVGGVGYGLQELRGAQHDEHSDTRPTSSPQGLSADEAVSRVSASLGSPLVQRIELINDPSDNPGGLPWVQVRMNPSRGEDVERVWLGELVEGAVAELMHTNQSHLNQVLGGGQVLDGRTQGDPGATSLGMGSAPSGQHYDSPSDEALRERVIAVATKYDLNVSSVEILHPLDSALAITLTVPDGDVPWTIDQLGDELDGGRNELEGLFIQLNSPDGQALLRTSTAARVQGGGVWFAPGQDERFGLVHG